MHNFKLKLNLHAILTCTLLDNISGPGEYDRLYRKLLKRRKTSLITSSDVVKQEFCSESEGNLNVKIETSKEKKQRKKKRKADESRDSCSSTENKDSVSRRKKLKKMKRKEESLRKKRMVKKLRKEGNENHGEIASIKSIKPSINRFVYFFLMDEFYNFV